MKITKKEVEHIAELARINLTEEEKSKLEKELSAILKFVEKLKEIDTDRVEPLTGGTTLENRIREDEQIEKTLEGKQTELVRQMPDRKESWLKVKSTFNNELK